MGEAEIKAGGMKNPPPMELNKDGTEDYAGWKTNIQIWERCTDIPEERRALVVHLSLRGRIQRASMEVGVEVLNSKNGMDALIKRLDSFFLQNKGIRQFNAFYNIQDYRRKEETNVNDFIGEFEHLCYKLKSEAIDLPDTIQAYCLLACCNLPQKDRNLIMAGIQEITYADMKSKIQQVFGNKIGMAENNESRSDPGLCAEKSPDVFYARNVSNHRGRSNFRGNFSNSRGNSSMRGRGNLPGSQANGYENQRQTGLFRGAPKYTRGKTGNPHKDGKQTQCFRCGSLDHWRHECPNPQPYRNGAMYARGNDEDEDEDYVWFTMSDTMKENNFTMFVGCTGESVLVNSLVDDSKGCGILDSGCTKTVCGERWLKDYVENLSDYEKSLVKEESSPASFTFGDGITVKSQKKLTLPCMIGGMKGKVVTDVVECDIPLLLSKKSMKSVGMILNFKEDKVKIGNKIIPLNSTTSGHYALPLCL